MSELAVFAYPKDLLGNDGIHTNLPGRPELFEKLRHREVSPGVSLFGEAAFQGVEVELLTLVGREEEIRQLGYTALAEVGVILNRLDRSFRNEDLPVPDAMPPVINANATRSLAFRKIDTHQKILEPLGLSIPTTLVTEAGGIEQFLDAHVADSFVLKPNSGTNSQNIHSLSRGEIMDFISAHPEMLGEYVLQPKLDFSGKFPATVLPYDLKSEEAFAGWNINGQIKELRVYGFHSPTDTQVFPVARAMKDGDNWFFVDPDSVPERVLEGTRSAIAKIAEATTAPAVYGTVDFGYGSASEGSQDRHAIELNGRMPYLVGYDKHQEVADNLRELFADQIAATVRYDGASY